MNKKNILMLTLSFGLYLTACNNGTNSTDPEKQANAENKEIKAIDNDDSKFMTEAASGGMMEVQAGQLAVQKGISQEVKDFGQQMITDHSAANDQLKTMAAQKNVILPEALSADDQKSIDHLNSVDAKDFDKTYMKLMVEDHKADVDKFQDVVNHPKDADVKAWAQNMLPTLLHHLDMAKTDKDIIDKK